MRKISDQEILGAIASSGLELFQDGSSIFVLGDGPEVYPAFHVNIVRKYGEFRLGGGIGIVVSEFESIWRNSLSREERKLDATLPIITALGNFRAVNEKDVMGYHSDLLRFRKSLGHLVRMLNTFPKSFDDFKALLRSGYVEGIPIKDLLHIKDYNKDDNIYFRKSANFVIWLRNTRKDVHDLLMTNLSDRQTKRLAQFERVFHNYVLEFTAVRLKDDGDTRNIP